jgi:hypothetical protein
MNPARKAVAAILVAMMFGTLAPHLCAVAVDQLSQAQSATIGRARVLSGAELATENLTNRQVASNRTERHRPDAVALPPRIDTAQHGHARVRTIAARAAAESVASAVTRGRAPPL